MPLDLTHAATETPSDVGITATPDGVNLAHAATVTPSTPSGVSASPMPAVAAAGVLLAKIVLAILAGALVVLLAYLWSSDWRATSNLQPIYKQIVAQAEAASGVPTVQAIEKLSASLREAAKNPQFKLAPADDQAGRDVIAALTHESAITDAQRKSLDRCIPLPPADTANRAKTLTDCAGIVDAAKKMAEPAAAASLERIRMLTEFSKQLNEFRQNFRTAWFQEAQLILLNLLLPLLTGLFGYIFGTQQGTNSKSGQ